MNPELRVVVPHFTAKTSDICVPAVTADVPFSSQLGVALAAGASGTHCPDGFTHVTSPHDQPVPFVLAVVSVPHHTLVNLTPRPELDVTFNVTPDVSPPETIAAQLSLEMAVLSVLYTAKTFFVTGMLLSSLHFTVGIIGWSL